MRALAICLLVAGVARADDSWRCGDRIVSLGESDREVLEKCGSPTDAKRRWERGRRRGGWVNQVVDVWTYDRGSQEFVRVLTLYDGVLREIVTDGYGR
jgi:hypothetical protein